MGWETAFERKAQNETRHATPTQQAVNKRAPALDYSPLDMVAVLRERGDWHDEGVGAPVPGLLGPAEFLLPADALEREAAQVHAARDAEIAGAQRGRPLDRFRVTQEHEDGNQRALGEEIVDLEERSSFARMRSGWEAFTAVVGVGGTVVALTGRRAPAPVQVAGVVGLVVLGGFAAHELGREKERKEVRKLRAGVRDSGNVVRKARVETEWEVRMAGIGGVAATAVTAVPRVWGGGRRR